jgi:hypothetical protein
VDQQLERGRDAIFELHVERCSVLAKIGPLQRLADIQRRELESLEGMAHEIREQQDSP